MKKTLFTIGFLLTMAFLGAEGQGESPSPGKPLNKGPSPSPKVTEAVLEYADDETAVQVYDASGKKRKGVSIGLKLNVGDSVATASTSAEIRLKPNGTLVKISEKTVVRWDSFQSLSENSTQVSLLGGKIRVVAASITGANYQLRTHGTALGVRGTDFVFQAFPGKGAEVIVEEGKIEFLAGERRGNLTNGQIWQSSRNSGPVTLGDKARTAAGKTMEFKKLDPKQVPRNGNKTISTLKLSQDSWQMSLEESFDFFKIPDGFWTDEAEFFGDLEAEGFFDVGDDFFD